MAITYGIDTENMADEEEMANRHAESMREFLRPIRSINGPAIGAANVKEKMKAVVIKDFAKADRESSFEIAWAKVFISRMPEYNARCMPARNPPRLAAMQICSKRIVEIGCDGGDDDDVGVDTICSGVIVRGGWRCVFRVTGTALAPYVLNFLICVIFWLHSQVLIQT